MASYDIDSHADHDAASPHGHNFDHTVKPPRSEGVPLSVF